MTRTCKQQQQLNAVSSTLIDEKLYNCCLSVLNSTSTITMETGIFRVFSACVLAFSFFFFYRAYKAFTCLYIYCLAFISIVYICWFSNILKYFNLIDLMNKNITLNGK